jgi:hypothetical protein
MRAMHKVEVGRMERLIFEDVKRLDDGEPESVLVSLELKDLKGSREITAHYGTRGFDDLSGFFQDLADHWRGWAGIRSYRSLEGDLCVEAKHTGSHVDLSIALQDPEFPHSWLVRGRLTLDAGEELASVSNALGELFAYKV